MSGARSGIHNEIAPSTRPHVFHSSPHLVWRTTLPGNPTALQFHHVRNHHNGRQQHLE